MPNPPASVQPIWIDDALELEGLAERLRGEPLVGLDTEFIRERTYYPQLCLLQLANRELTACIDVLNMGLEPLIPLLRSSETLTVMHAGRQDLETLQQTLGLLPAPLFDTQVAAALCGSDAQPAYAQLVEAHFGARLDKTQSRTDWTRRPLSHAQLDYAAQDVLFLPPLHDILREELAARGRSGWLDEEMQRLLDPALYLPDPAQAWQRVKGKAVLRTAAARAALRRLADWREAEAMHRNRPRQWIAADAALVSLAEQRPASPAALSALDAVPPKLRQRHGATLLELVACADALPDEADTAPAGPLEPAQRNELERLQQLTRGRAAALGLKPELLAPRRELEALVRGERELNVLRGWRRETLGDDLLGALARET